MKKRKLLLSLTSMITVVGTVLTLSSCGQSAKPNFVIPEGGFDTETPVSIDFYSTMGTELQKVFDEYLKDFKVLYPNITVNHTQPGGYNDVRDQIKTELSVGKGPNLAYCYPDHVALYNKARAVVTLDNLIDDTTYGLGLTKEQKDDFIEGYWDEGKSFGDDLMYTLPFSKSTEVLYYNKTVFEENNLKVPTTWDEMEEVCRQLKTIYPDSIPLGYDSESNWFITMTEQYNSKYTSATGNHYLFNNKTNKDFVSKFKTWYDNGYVTTQEIYGAYTSGLFVETTAAKRSFMSIGSSAGATHQRPTKGTDGKYPFEVGITSIPQIDAKNNPAVISQGPSICIFKNEDPQKVMASWLLVKFLTTDVAFQAEFSMASGYVPVLKSVSENETYKTFIDSADGGDHIAALSAKVCLEQKDWYYTSPAFIGSSDARDEVGKIITSVFLGTKTIDKAFEEAVSECEYKNP